MSAYLPTYPKYASEVLKGGRGKGEMILYTLYRRLYREEG